MKKIIPIILLCLILIGPLTYSKAIVLVENELFFKNVESYNGYNLLSENDGILLLLDMDGNKIHSWENISFGGIMLPGGTAIGPSRLREKYIFGREYCEMIEQNWEGGIQWNFSNWDYDENGMKIARQHHDFIREGNPIGYYAPSQNFLTNGKTLILAHKNINNINISNKEIIDDVIYEVDYEGNLTGYEWHASDHFEEFEFSSIEKIGIFLFPGYHLFLSLPYFRNKSFIKFDWFHLNSITKLGNNHFFDNGDNRFKPENIMICSRHANIIAIIDYQTGNLVWKIGPDYSANTIEGRKIKQIIGPHHAHMIPEGLPGAGNILIFDNGGFAGYGLLGMPNKFRYYSRILEIDPSTKEIVWQYDHKNGLVIIPSGEHHKFFSEFLSSVQRLPNGNTLITEGMSKRVFEVTKDKEIVWEFIFSDIIYRCYRIPPEWVPGNPANYEYWENI
jgi:hypothetical protein